MYEVAGEPVRDDLVAAFQRAWVELGAAGTWWNAEAKIAIAAAARAARSGQQPEAGPLPAAAVDAAAVLAARPAYTSEEWVTATCDDIGEPSYVELVGVVARVMAIDTFHRLTGRPLASLPEPQPGEPTRTPPPEGARKNRTWVAMTMPSPPFVLGLVPEAMAAMNDLSETLYMPMDEMNDPDWQRGSLHRTQIELVAAATSHANQCFF